MSTTEEQEEDMLLLEAEIEAEAEANYKETYQWLVGKCLRIRDNTIVKVTEIIYEPGNADTVSYRCIRVHCFTSDDHRSSYEIKTEAYCTTDVRMIAPFTVSEQVFQDSLYFWMTKINKLAKAKETAQ